MKKVVLIVCALVVFVSCTPELLQKDDTNATDKTELCPPSDRNCNGIPDSEE